jgi:hypothetical protein
MRSGWVKNIFVVRVIGLFACINGSAPVVTPHLRCAFHQCTGDFLLLLGLIGFAFTFQLSHKILQMVQPSETQQHEQQRMLIERESKRSWKFGREYDRLQTGRVFGST